MGFFRPTPACLTSEHHQTGPTLVARELWIPEFFGSPRLVQRSSVTSSTLPSWSTICSDNTDHCGVDGQLSAMEKREAVCHHFQSTVVHSWHGQEVQILGMFWETPARVRTSSPVMATRVKWLATPASCRRQSKLAPKATKEQHPTAGQNELQKRLGAVKNGMLAMTSLGSCHSLVTSPQPGRDRSVEERFLYWCAKTCQPILGKLGNSSSGWNPGRCPLSISPHSGTSIPTPWRRVRHSFAASKWNSPVLRNMDNNKWSAIPRKTAWGGQALTSQTVLRCTFLGGGVRVRTVEPRSTVWEGSDKKMWPPQTVERGSTVRAL